MHPRHASPLDGLAIAVMVIAVVLEWGLVFVRPTLLARLAFIPVGRRVIALPPQTREALISRAMDAVDYRTAPVESFQPGRLATPETVTLDGNKKLIFTPRGDVVVAPTFTLVKKQRNVILAKLVLEGDRIVVSAKSYPEGLILMIFFLAAIVLTPHAPDRVAFFLLLGGAIAVAVGRRSANATLDRIAAEVSRRVERLGALRVPDVSETRVATDLPDMPIDATGEDVSGPHVDEARAVRDDPPYGRP